MPDPDISADRQARAHVDSTPAPAPMPAGPSGGQYEIRRYTDLIRETGWPASHRAVWGIEPG